MEARACFLPDFTLCAFLFVDLALYASAVINVGCEYDYLLSPVGSPSKSPTLGMFLGNIFPTRKSYSSQCFFNIPWALGFYSTQYVQ